MNTTFQLNGKPVPTAVNQTVSALLEGQGIDPSQVVVEINRKIINRDVFETTVINPDDTVEVLRFVGGG